MKVNIIIPNFNGSNLILKNLPSVIQSLSSYPESWITIVDDRSQDSDFLKVENFVEEANKRGKNKIELIRKDKNSGFSGAVNTGALKSESDILILLNTDVSPEKDFLTQILKDFEENKNLFGVGCLDKSEEDGKIVHRGRGLGAWRRGILVHSKGEVGKADTFWVSGGSSAIRTELFKKLGGFDEIYNPFYWEDIDLSYRASRAGYDLLFESKSMVTHRHSEGAIKKHYKKNNINKIAYRNQFIFIWKNITDLNLLFSHVIWFPYHVSKSLIRRDLAFFQGFLLALIKLPDIIKTRNIQREIFKKTDKEVLFPNS